MLISMRFQQSTVRCVFYIIYGYSLGLIILCAFYIVLSDALSLIEEESNISRSVLVRLQNRKIVSALFTLNASFLNAVRYFTIYSFVEPF